MSNAIVDQPPPIKTDKRPIWPVVIQYVENNYADADGMSTVTNVISDMRTRHQVGIERYGVPLTAGNGRDSMVDAYQELLDFVVYTRTWLEERGIEVLAPGVFMHPTEGLKVDADGRGAEVVDDAAFKASMIVDPVESMMANMFVRSLEALLSLRGAMP